MTTTIESVLDSSTTISETGLSKASIVTSIDSISEILVLKSGETLETSTTSIGITTEKAPISLVEVLGSITKLEVEFIGGKTEITPAISGLNGRDGAHTLRELTDVDTQVLAHDTFLRYDGLSDSFDFVPVQTQTSGTVRYEVDRFVLTSTDISNKYVILSFLPENMEEVNVTSFPGIEQEYLVDFYIVGHELRWDNLAMELLLEEGYRLLVRYNRVI